MPAFLIKNLFIITQILSCLPLTKCHSIRHYSSIRVLGRFKEVIVMTKSELIQRIASQNPHLFLRDVEKIVETIFEEITQALVRDDRVELRGFGAFSVKHRDARTGRNPRTGETVNVDAKRLPYYKPGKALREELNEEPVETGSTSYF